MQAIDINGMGNYFLDKNRQISPEHRKNICKMGQGHETCRYIGLSINGFFCAKNTPIKEALDKQVEKGDLNARGDNCKGLGEK